MSFFGELARLAEPEAFKARMRAPRQSPFVVYDEPPFGGPARVLAYLARSPIAPIPTSRLVAVDDNEVAFVYKDYRRGGRSRIDAPRPARFIRVFSSTSYPTAGIAFVTPVSAGGERAKSRICARPAPHASKPQDRST